MSRKCVAEEKVGLEAERRISGHSLPPIWHVPCMQKALSTASLLDSLLPSQRQDGPRACRR